MVGLPAEGKAASGVGRPNVGGGDGDEDEFKEANWDLIPAPPITPPAAFRPNPDACYRRISAFRRGKERSVGVFMK